jgi:hypothetical protein
MQTNNALNSNPYIDEITANLGAASAAFKNANLNPSRIDTLEDVKAASITDNSKTEFEKDVEDLVTATEYEVERQRDPRTDDFSSHDPYKDRHGSGKDQDQQQKREPSKERRLGKVGRKEAPEPTREEVFKLLDGMDQMLDAAQEASEVKDTDKEFENWNNWFKAEKKAPPAPDSSKVFYIREEYNTKRSPHLWKSNPNKKWVLAFGASDINNVVAANLFKYQNDTISKDA